MWVQTPVLILIFGSPHGRLNLPKPGFPYICSLGALSSVFLGCGAIRGICVPRASQSQLPVPVASEGHSLVPVASQQQLQNLLEVCQTGPPPLQASQAQSLATISLLQVLPTESLQTQPVDLQVVQAILDLQATYHTQQVSQSMTLCSVPENSQV